MNYKTKPAFIIFELLLVIVISSFVLINSFISIKDIYLFTKYQQKIAILKIDLLSSKIFIQNNIENIDKLNVKNNKLYFGNSILLEKIEKLSILKKEKYLKITLKRNNKDIIWILNL